MDTLGFVVLRVADLEASLCFYRDGLGLPLRLSRPRFAELGTAGAGLALQAADADHPPTRGAGLYLVTADVAAAREAAAARGVAFAGPPVEEPWEGGALVATARDPDGNRVGLIEFLSRLRVFAGSVLDAGAEAIVNAANTELRQGGGVAAAIAAAAGPELVAESRRLGFCPLGQACATTAGRLPARLVVHVPTIDYTSGRRAGGEELVSGARAALEICQRQGVRRVAFPLLGAGVAALAPEESVRALRQAALAFPHLEVVVCAYSAADRRAVKQVLGEGHI